MIRLTHAQIMNLLEADWREDGPVRLNDSLSLEELSRSLVLVHARLILRRMDDEGGIKLTATGNFSRKFVERMVREFRWPDFEPERVWRLQKVLNEADFLPLDFLHVILGLAGLGRKFKGTYRVSRLGRALLDPDAAGALNALLFDTVFNDYNLAYLDGGPDKGDFQSQIGFILFVMSKVDGQPRTAEQWMTAATLPLEPRQSSSCFRPETDFEWRVLRYLEWFGLMERSSPAANDDWRTPWLFRKTPLFDRFLCFRV